MTAATATLTHPSAFRAPERLAAAAAAACVAAVTIVLLLIVLAGIAPTGATAQFTSPGPTTEPAPVRQPLASQGPVHVAVPTPGAPIR